MKPPHLEYINFGGDFMLENVNFILCGVILPIAICLVGVFFVAKLRFFYILHPIKAFKTIVHSGGGFKPLCVALAGVLGVGNIVGVASAIIMGGAGAVFWMLLSAFIAMSVKYAEVFLSIKHRRGSVDNYYGGAPYYIQDALGGKQGRFFGGVFAVLCILNSLSTGNLVQISSISDLLPNSRLTFGICFAIIVLLVVRGGEARIQNVSSVLIPILSLSYICISLYIIFSNFSEVCVAISRIFTEAFAIKSVCGGAIGYGIGQAIRYGFTRGLLSNEAGCGTATIAHASSKIDAHSQGCLGIFEVFWDTVVLCLITALVILTANTGESNPILLAVSSYGAFTGELGRFFIAFSCALFALATVGCQYYYGERALRYLSSSRLSRALYSVVFFSVCIFSTIISSALMWHISDFTVAFLALINLVFLIILSKEVK